MKLKNNEKLSHLFIGLIIGIITGLVVSLYRLSSSYLSDKMKIIYEYGRNGLLNAIIVILFICLLGYIVGKMVDNESYIGGSGIPQILGEMDGVFNSDWKKILPLKFFAGIITLSAGLTVGAASPSAHLGSMVGKAISKKRKFINEKTKIYIMAGASAGLSAAFNAPITGIIFAIEQLYNTFDKKIFIALTSSSIGASVISTIISGTDPIIDIGRLTTTPLKSYPYIILMGIIIGLLAPIFSNGIYLFKRIYKKINLRKELKIIIPFLITAIVILIYPDSFGAGQDFIYLSSKTTNLDIYSLIITLVLKYMLLAIAFSSGIPGGIFLPILVQGSLIGNIFGQSLLHFGLIDNSYILFFTALAMCSFFSAVVRTPLTSMILLLEVTGSFIYFLPASIAILSSYMIVELLNITPIYDKLLEILIKDQREIT